MLFCSALGALSFQNTDLPPQKIVFQSTFSLLYSHSLTLLCLLIVIIYSRSIRCVNAYQMTGFCMSLIFTEKGTSKQTLNARDLDFIGKAERVLWFSTF